MKFEEIEGIILKDGWKLKNSNGSHFQYKHPVKTGKVTIPCHRGDIHPKTISSILRQAKLK